ncbi:MAG: 50S ribosomal protein L5 [Methanobacteriota archaeon]
MPAKKTSEKPVKKTSKKKPVKVKTAEKTPENKISMTRPRIEKITINIGVGEAGEKLSKAQSVLKGITGQKPVQTFSRTTNKDWGIRDGMPLGCKVTLRGKKAQAFLVEALKIRNNQVSDYSFDNQGNISFGVPDHTLFKDQRYDPNIGIFGMDICVTIQKPGYRIKHRRIDRRKIPQRHQITPEETMEFLKEAYQVEVV